MKKTGKTVAYPMVPNLRFLSASVPQGSLQGPSPSELVSDGFREDLAEGPPESFLLSHARTDVRG